MSKLFVTAIMSGSFAIGLTLLPTEGAWRMPLCVAAWAVFAISGIWCLRVYLKDRPGPVRGDLHVTVLNFAYEDKAGEIIADLMFFNNDSIQRTIIGVTFLYRKSESEKGYEFIASGPNSAPFIGHINPVNIAPGSNETRHYSATFDPTRIKVVGAQVGLLITFTIPERGDESATVMPAMQVVKTGDLSTPSLQMPIIRNLSLDSIRDSKQIDAIVGRLALQQHSERSIFRKMCDRLFDYW
jgi:hypothetical protein